MIFLLRNLKLVLILGAVASLIVLLYFWRADIVEGTKNAYRAITNEKAIEVNIQSKKGSDNVRQEVQALDNSALDRELCFIGIVYESKGCNDQ